MLSFWMMFNIFEKKSWSKLAMNDGRFLTPNPPVYRVSTVLFESTEHLEALKAKSQELSQFGGDANISLYGTSGTPTHAELCTEILKSEGGFGVVLSPSGLAALTIALLAVVKSGDHVLVADHVYSPFRQLVERFLPRMNVGFDFYDPSIAESISDLIRPNTRCVWIESPGSLTFEVQVRLCASMRGLFG